MPDIHVSAAILFDEEDRVLVVRKHGTTRFMQPGGKPEGTESPAETLSRELCEELSLVIPAQDFAPLGEFVSAAANEPGHRVIAEAFSHRIRAADVQVQAEIAEARWITQGDVPHLALAPLSIEHLLPLAWAQLRGDAV